MNLTATEKTSWSKIKSELLKRPLLLFRIGLNQTETSNLLTNTYPDKQTLSFIKEELTKIRLENTERLKTSLTDIVNHRGSTTIAKKIGTDGMTIKYIVDGKQKKQPPSHDLISKIELYLSYKMDYEISLENKQDEVRYLPNEIDRLKLSTQEVGLIIVESKRGFDKLQQLKKGNHKENTKTLDYYEINRLKHQLRRAIETLENIESKTLQIIENHQ